MRCRARVGFQMAERERAQAAEARRQPVESAINNLEHRGLDRVRLRRGFAHTVALSILAANLHRIGLLVRRRMTSKTPRC